MSTIEINRVDDLREGDFVTLRWEFVDGATVTLEGPMWNRMVGAYAVTDARFVSATREVPDDIEALRRSLEAAREGYRKEAADRRARDQRLGAEIDRLEAEAEQLRLEVAKYREEVERLRAAALPTDLTVCICSWDSEDRGGGYSEVVAEYEPACPVHSEHVYDPRAGVWTKPGARTLPTRKQIVDAMWPNAPESARAGMTHLGAVDRIVELFGQGDES